MRCITCRKDKNPDQFLKIRGTGYGKRCRSCRERVSETSSKWFEKHGFPEEYRHNRRQKVYGLGPDEYELMKQTQGDVCAICDQPRPLVVDHCHETGKVRGLLCAKCNTGIGLLKDDVQTLEAAIRYLLRTKE